MKDQREQPQQKQQKTQEKKEYSTPKLTDYGHVKDLSLNFIQI